MSNPMEGINWKGVLNVVAGQYLCYLAYKIHQLPDVPANRTTLLLIATILFVICGIGLCIWGFRMVIVSYRDSREEADDTTSANESSQQ